MPAIFYHGSNYKSWNWFLPNRQMKHMFKIETNLSFHLSCILFGF